MSYAVIHMQKLKMGGMKGIENHNERLKESKTNDDINYELSHLNKDMMEQDNRTYYMRVKDRIKELDLPKAVRKDAVVSCGFICTSDKAFFDGLSQEEQDRFFEVAHDFLKDRYGEKNVIASKVHYDEYTPHMHTYIVPVTEDGRLSAKDIFNKAELRNLQDDYHRTMNEHGFVLERGEGGKKRLSEQEFKIATKFEELKDKQAELERLEAIDSTVRLDPQKGKMGIYSNKEVDELKEQNKALRLEVQEKKWNIIDLERDNESLQNRLSKAERDKAQGEVYLERLKDLESQSEALTRHVEATPELTDLLKPYHEANQRVNVVGEHLAKWKTEYKALDGQKQDLIEQTGKLTNDMLKCENDVLRLSEHDKTIKTSKERLNALEGELESVTGGFKNLTKFNQRRELTEKIESEQAVMQRATDDLFQGYQIDPSQIAMKQAEIEERKLRLAEERNATQSQRVQCEKDMQKRVDDYKYYRSIADGEDVHRKDMIDRREKKVELTPREEKVFTVYKEDRESIRERLKEKHPSYVEQVEGAWKEKDMQRNERKRQEPTSELQKRVQESAEKAEPKQQAPKQKAPQMER